MKKCAMDNRQLAMGPDAAKLVWMLTASVSTNCIGKKGLFLEKPPHAGYRSQFNTWIDQ